MMPSEVSVVLDRHSPAAPRAAPGRAPARIVLADDHRVVRSGIALLLAADGAQIVAQAGDLDGALRAVLGHKPDVLLLEITLPGALDALPYIAERSPGTATVILTNDDDVLLARRALRAGALGYLHKNNQSADLLSAVRLAAAGEPFLDPSLGARIAALPEIPDGPPDDLSARELEVLRMIALGHTNAAIGGHLFLSVRTVETHRAHVQQKLRRTSRAELVRYALDHGLLREGAA